MHELAYFREHLDEFEQMAANRGVAIDFAAFRALDQERRERITAAERLKAERNKASEEIARRKKAGEDASALLAEMKRVSEEIKLADERVTVLDAQLSDFMLTVPNRPHSSVPVGHDAVRECRGAPLGRAAKIRFQAAPALGNRRRRRASSISSAPRKSPARVSRSIAAWARAWNARLPHFFSIRTRQTDTPKFFRPSS